MKKYHLLFVVVLFCSALFGQNTTISKKNKNEREGSSGEKVMLVPFEPKMYMSEIDRYVNIETGLSAHEIKYRFRNGINEQLYKAFKATGFGVVDLMDDTTKYHKDTESIYQYLTYNYQKVPNQENYKTPEKEKAEKKIDKGQLVIETNSDVRFMNAKLTNAKVVPLLYAKYKTTVFVFISQLDIKGASTPDDISVVGGVSRRKITVHYTVYSYDAKEINSGIAETTFEPELNNQKKIIDKHFSKIAQTIVQRVNKALQNSAAKK